MAVYLNNAGGSEKVTIDGEKVKEKMELFKTQKIARLSTYTDTNIYFNNISQSVGNVSFISGVSGSSEYQYGPIIYDNSIEKYLPSYGFTDSYSGNNDFFYYAGGAYVNDYIKIKRVIGDDFTYYSPSTLNVKTILTYLLSDNNTIICYNHYTRALETVCESFPEGITSPSLFIKNDKLLCRQQSNTGVKKLYYRDAQVKSTTWEEISLNPIAGEYKIVFTVNNLYLVDTNTNIAYEIDYNQKVLIKYTTLTSDIVKLFNENNRLQEFIIDTNTTTTRLVNDNLEIKELTTGPLPVPPNNGYISYKKNNTNSIMAYGFEPNYPSSPYCSGITFRTFKDNNTIVYKGIDLLDSNNIEKYNIYCELI